ncbi:MAG: hypothetical protein VX951_01825 [Planctomycetota bacterium]|nr:hypothetical protein [Planctomycetota bacterium]
MSLPLEPAFSLLKEHFVVGWKNIHREDYVGHSHGYTCENAAVGTTNGAGPRNMQLYVLAADGTVLHCLPGFWHPEDLAHELRFAQAIHRLHKDKRSSKSKRAMYQRLHQSAIRNQPPAMAARSGWQGFDALNEKNRLKMLKTGTRDTFYYENGKPTKLKPTSVVLHERMAKRPFMSFRKFDTETFVDYGRPYYDNNAGIEGTGVKFGSKGFMASQQRMAKRRAERAEHQRKVDDYYGKKPKTDKYSGKKSKAEEKRWAQMAKKKEAATKPQGSKKKAKPTSRPMRRKSKTKTKT